MLDSFVEGARHTWQGDGRQPTSILSFRRQYTRSLRFLSSRGWRLQSLEELRGSNKKAARMAEYSASVPFEDANIKGRRKPHSPN